MDPPALDGREIDVLVARELERAGAPVLVETGEPRGRGEPGPVAVVGGDRRVVGGQFPVLVNWVTRARAWLWRGSLAWSPGTTMSELPSGASEAIWPKPSVRAIPLESTRPPTTLPPTTSVVPASVWYRRGKVLDFPLR